MYNSLMVHSPLDILLKQDVRDITLVTSEEHISQFKKYLGDGRDFGAHIEYTAQTKEKMGIAIAIDSAVKYTSKFEGKYLVVLGDNYLHDQAKIPEQAFTDDNSYILTVPVEEPRHFGCPKYNEEGNLVDLIEKPQGIPPSNRAITGIYIFPARDLSSKLASLKPSARKEYEVTDLSKSYLLEGRLKEIQHEGLWIDSGSSFDHRLQTILAQAVKSVGYRTVERMLKDIKDYN